MKCWYGLLLCKPTCWPKWNLNLNVFLRFECCQHVGQKKRLSKVVKANRTNMLVWFVGQHVVRFAPAFKQVIQKLFVSILTGVTSRGSRSFISNLVSGWNFQMAENIANNWDVYTPLNCGSRDLGPTWRGIILSDNASYIFYITFITDWLRI